MPERFGAREGVGERGREYVVSKAEAYRDDAILISTAYRLIRYSFVCDRQQRPAIHASALQQRRPGLGPLFTVPGGKLGCLAAE